MDGTVFAFDPDWVSTLNAPFMTNALLAGLCIALAAGVMGYFTIARHSTFAAHALAHIGLPGATGAVLLGLPVSAGLGVFALGALVITPAATANIIARSPFKAMVVATAICLISIWGGLVLSTMFPAPPSFIIVTISTLFWAIAKAVESFKRK